MLERGYTPDGRPPVDVVGEQVLYLRVDTDLGTGPGPSPDRLTLADGAEAQGSVTGDGTVLAWEHNGVEYVVTASGMTPAQILTAVNSLP